MMFLATNERTHMLYRGPTVCAASFKCVAVSPPYYYQVYFHFPAEFSCANVISICAVPIDGSLEASGKGGMCNVDSHHVIRSRVFGYKISLFVLECAKYIVGMMIRGAVDRNPPK